ncbi:MAG: hypothetical protein U9Q22_02655 [Candidatus Altiarchaeota archaeon]|nr:hypothetical protein [Candidatus Altiarchaeota archaeon]
MEAKTILILGLLLISSVNAEDPSGNLTVSNSIIYIGESIDIFIEGSDDVDVTEIYAKYEGSWHRYDCVGIQTYCNHTWTWSSSAIGTYEISGWVRDDENAVFTTPESFYVTVLPLGTTTTVPGATTTTVPGATTTTTVPGATTTTTVPGATTTTSTTTIPPMPSLDIVGGFINYVVCTILRLMWFIVGAFAALLIIMAGVEYMTTEDPKTRDNAKGRVVNVAIALIIILITVPLVGYIIKDTDIAELECDNWTLTPPPSIPVTTTTLPENYCRISAVNIGGYWVYCGEDESFGGNPGICPEHFNPMLGGCPPGSVIVCNPPDPNC